MNCRIPSSDALCLPSVRDCGMVFVVVNPYLKTCLEMFWLCEISPHDYEVWDIPWSAVCKIESQESQWCNSVWVPNFSLSANGVNKSQSKGHRRWDVSPTQLSEMGRSGEFSILCLLVCSDPQQIGWCHHTGEDNLFFLNSSIQMLIWSWNTLTDTPRN